MTAFWAECRVCLKCWGGVCSQQKQNLGATEPLQEEVWADGGGATGPAHGLNGVWVKTGRESLEIIPPPRRRPKLRGARRVCVFASPPASRFLRPHPEFFPLTVSRTRAPAGAGVSLASEPPEPPGSSEAKTRVEAAGGRRGREEAREGSPGPRAPPTAPRTQLRVPARAPRTQGAACGKAPDATQGSRGCSRESTSRPRAQRPPAPPSDRPGPRGRGPRAFLVARQPGGSSFPRPWRGAEGHRFPRWRPATGWGCGGASGKSGLPSWFCNSPQF